MAASKRDKDRPTPPRQRVADPLADVCEAYVALERLLDCIEAAGTPYELFILADESDSNTVVKAWIRHARLVVARQELAKRRINSAHEFLVVAGEPLSLGGVENTCAHEAGVRLADPFLAPAEVIALGTPGAKVLRGAPPFHEWVNACAATFEPVRGVRAAVKSEFYKARRLALESDGIHVRWRSLPRNWQEIFQALDRGPLRGDALLDAAQGTERGSSGTLKNDLANMVTLGILSHTRAKGAAGYSQKARFHDR
jgi:hypothetical protein